VYRAVKKKAAYDFPKKTCRSTRARNCGFLVTLPGAQLRIESLTLSSRHFLSITITKLEDCGIGRIR
jgi:hypothetical protein